MTLKVLVADDSITIQKIVALAFAGEDVTIESVSDGNAAREVLRRSRPDIVLADVFMPGCSGYEVCESVKENPELKDIPVILLVGTFEPFDQAEAGRVKCDGHLTKPFDTEELIDTIRAHVGGWAPVGAPADASGSAGRNIPRLELRVSTAAISSFLGDSRVLEIFDAGFKPARPAGKAAMQPPGLSEETLNILAEKVVRKMSPDVVREVAWEVVPELSEAIIRQTIKEQK